MISKVILKEGRERSVRQFHPWIYSGAIDNIQGNPQAGEIVRVLDSRQEFLAYGYINTRSRIVVRLLEWQDNEPPDKPWWQARLKESLARRDRIIRNGEAGDACRLVFGEADLIPGLIVDRYGDFLVMQVLTYGIELVKSLLVDVLVSLTHPKGIYERSDVDVREHEGLPQTKGILFGEEPPDQVIIRENAARFRVDIKSGQKTGFYLDQKENRRQAADYAADAEVLDCFCHSGAFSVQMLSGGARAVTAVDSSAHSLELMKSNIDLNDLADKAVDYIKGDVFQVLRHLCREKKVYDLIVLDPPKLAVTRFQLPKALTAYKDLNLIAMRLLRPGGLLVTFSCSGAVDPQSFRTAVLWASYDAGRRMQILKSLSQPEDHPRLLSFPEGEYLKGIIGRVI